MDNGERGLTGLNPHSVQLEPEFSLYGSAVLTYTLKASGKFGGLKNLLFPILLQTSSSLSLVAADVTLEPSHNNSIGSLSWIYTHFCADCIETFLRFLYGSL